MIRRLSRDPDFRAGYRIGRAQVAAARRRPEAGPHPPRRGCLPLLILPVCVALAWAGALIFAAVS